MRRKPNLDDPDERYEFNRKLEDSGLTYEEWREEIGSDNADYATRYWGME